MKGFTLAGNLARPSGTEAMDQPGNAFSSREPVSGSRENSLGADHRPRRLAVGGGPMPRLLRILRPATI